MRCEDRARAVKEAAGAVSAGPVPLGAPRPRPLYRQEGPAPHPGRQPEEQALWWGGRQAGQCSSFGEDQAVAPSRPFTGARGPPTLCRAAVCLALVRLCKC